VEKAHGARVTDQPDEPRDAAKTLTEAIKNAV
jgi:hypothetical protein